MISQHTTGWTTETAPGLGRVVLAPEVPAGYALFYTTRDFSGRFGESEVEALQRFLRERFQMSVSMVSCSQVHGVKAQKVQPGGDWREVGECDALWSDAPATAIAIKVADCLPVSIIDTKSGVIANIHSGWRGAAAQITERTLDALASTSALDARSASVWLGPSLQQGCFEIGEEVVEQFERSYGSVKAYLDRSRGERPYLDLPSLVRDAMVRKGIRPERIHDSELCTRCDGSIFHSYRRDKSAVGRVLAVLARA